MKLFRCQACDQVLHFENVRCERCGHALGFAAEAMRLTALEPADDPSSMDGTGPGEVSGAGPHDAGAPAVPPGAAGAVAQGAPGYGAAAAGGRAARFRTLAEPERLVRYCGNAEYDACNWLVEEGSSSRLCRCCRHNRTVPDLTVSEHMMPWRQWQVATRRLTYTLLRLGLRIPDRIDNPTHGLAWDMLADPTDGRPKVLTGHSDGVITLALAEADDLERERRRAAMGEPYRTLLGHVRHESGHLYWDMLVRDTTPDRLDDYRALFGDERPDYNAALARHHAQGPPADWRDGFVSAYATAHPWEDFAETWAHWLHIVDTLEMASAFHLSVAASADRSGLLSAVIDLDPYTAPDVGALIEAWLPLTHAVNSLNRCMGAPDLYPFVLSQPVVHKLGWVHRLVRDATALT